MGKAEEIVKQDRRELVNKLVTQMESDYTATRAKWNHYACRPYNPVSNVQYKGGNWMRLMLAAAEHGYSDPRWMTFDQASSKGYRIKAGSKSVFLEKWIYEKDVPKLDADGKPELDEHGKQIMEQKKLSPPIVNYFRVFNAEQIIGVPELEHKEVQTDDFSHMADQFEQASRCPVSYEAQDRAYYSPAEDKIHLPLKESFRDNEARLSVLLHEMAHSTGHVSRLDRPLDNSFGSIPYAREELNAEISAIFLENELGIPFVMNGEREVDHAKYVKSWIALLKENPDELFYACSSAEKITDFLMKDYEKIRSQEIGQKQDIQLKYYIERIESGMVEIYDSFDEAKDLFLKGVEDKRIGIMKADEYGDSHFAPLAGICLELSLKYDLFATWQTPKDIDNWHLLQLNSKELEMLDGQLEYLDQELQVRNIVFQEQDALNDICKEAREDIGNGHIDRTWTAHVVNLRHPEKYIELCLRGSSQEQQIERTIRVVNDDKIMFSMEKAVMPLDEFRNSDVVHFEDQEYYALEEQVRALPQTLGIQLNVPYGERAFTVYTRFGWDRLQEHMDMLGRLGLQELPYDYEKIRVDIERSGYQPTRRLVRNLARLEWMENRPYSLQQLADMHKKDSSFRDHFREARKCIGDIIEELQGQELAEVPQLKQGSQIPQMAAEAGMMPE